MTDDLQYAISDLQYEVAELRLLVNTLIDAELTARQNDADRLRDVLRLERQISELRQRIEAWDETAAILSDPKLLAAILASNEEIAAGHTVNWESIKAQLKGDSDAA